jgi:hypothetical protein
MCHEVKINQPNSLKESAKFMKLPAVNDHAFTYERKLMKK